MLSIGVYIFITLTIFLIGVSGFIRNRQNIMFLLMSLEIMYLASTLNFAFYTYHYDSILGTMFILYLLIVVGAESCVGLSLIAVYFSIHKDISLDRMDISRR